MTFLYKIGRPLAAAAGVMLSGALLAGCAAAPYPAEAGYPPPGAGGAPPEAGMAGWAPPSPEYAQNASPQAGYGAPASQGYGAPASQDYGPPPSSQGYGPPPSSQGYGPPPGGSYGGPGITRAQFIERARHWAIMHGRDPQLAARRANWRFNLIDVDHDGIIQPAEMRAWRATHPPYWRAQGAPPPSYGYGPTPAGSPYQQ